MYLVANYPYFITIFKTFQHQTTTRFNTFPHSLKTGTLHFPNNHNLRIPTLLINDDAAIRN